eukprot:4378924-Pleurochrysis_carterae.AAC.2
MSRGCARRATPTEDIDEFGHRHIGQRALCFVTGVSAHLGTYWDDFNRRTKLILGGAVGCGRHQYGAPLRSWHCEPLRSSRYEYQTLVFTYIILLTILISHDKTRTNARIINRWIIGMGTLENGDVRRST